MWFVDGVGNRYKSEPKSPLRSLFEQSKGRVVWVMEVGLVKSLWI